MYRRPGQHSTEARTHTDSVGAGQMWEGATSSRCALLQSVGPYASLEEQQLSGCCSVLSTGDEGYSLQART